MADTAFSETSRLLTRFHVRKIQRVAQHTLDEIVARFPSHLIDDVNARGLPPDRTLAALAEVFKRAPTLPKDHLMVVNLSGRGDKDMSEINIDGSEVQRDVSLNRAEEKLVEMSNGCICCTRNPHGRLADLRAGADLGRCPSAVGRVVH